jgi:hypothetical protein
MHSIQCRVITFIQIAQFMFSLVLAVMSARLHLVVGVACEGMAVMYGSIVFNITLLSEFAAIFRDNKGSGGAKGKKAKKGNAAPSRNRALRACFSPRCNFSVLRSVTAEGEAVKQA